MSKFKVAGDAVVITSSMKLGDLKTIEKYRPDALILKGGADNKEPIFAITTKGRYGHINSNGATFVSESHDDEKLATITMCVEDFEGDIKEFIADTLGLAKTRLDNLEETLPAVLSAIVEERTAIMDSIEVVQ